MAYIAKEFLDSIQSVTLSTILHTRTHVLHESASKYRLILYINCKSMLFVKLLNWGRPQFPLACLLGSVAFFGWVKQFGYQ